MNYQQRIAKVLDYIGKHIDEPLSLDALSEVAFFSKFHFHRIFSACMGLSLHQYVRWLRLKRAAHQLVVEQDRKIIDIALTAGFESQEAFSRAFKKECGISPNDFRVQMSWDAWEKPPYCLTVIGDKKMKVVIKEKEARRLAVVEHRGDPNAMGETVNKLIEWRKAHSLGKPKPRESFGFGYDDPKLTEPAEFRFDIGTAVSEQVKMGEGIVEKRLPAGRYAVAVHKGSHEQLDKTVYGIYRDWLPESGEELGDLPCVFCYHNFEYEVPESELVTECWVLLK